MKTCDKERHERIPISSLGKHWEEEHGSQCGGGGSRVPLGGFREQDQDQERQARGPGAKAQEALPLEVMPVQGPAEREGPPILCSWHVPGLTPVLASPGSSLLSFAVQRAEAHIPGRCTPPADCQSQQPPSPLNHRELTRTCYRVVHSHTSLGREQ